MKIGNFSTTNTTLFGVNRAELLWLNTHDFLPAKPVQGAHCIALKAAEFEQLAQNRTIGGGFDIDDQLVKDFATEGFTGIAMFIGDKLIGMTLFSTETLPARYNKLGDISNGLDIAIPPGTRCMFKAVVLPEFRGKRLHSAMVRFAIDHFGKDIVHTIVAACCASNKEFLASCKNQGFERVGKFSEYCLMSKSFYRLPKPIDSVLGEPSDDEDRAIVLRKAA